MKFFIDVRNQVNKLRQFKCLSTYKYFINSNPFILEIYLLKLHVNYCY